MQPTLKNWVIAQVIVESWILTNEMDTNDVYGGTEAVFQWASIKMAFGGHQGIFFIK